MRLYSRLTKSLNTIYHPRMLTNHSIGGCSIMKKLVTLIVLVFVLIIAVGCVDYKAYDIPQDEQTQDDELINEIAQIEEDLANQENEITGEVTQEEVMLPKADEQEVDPEVVEEIDLALEDLQEITVKENERVKLLATVTDPDQDPTTHSFSLPLNDKGEWKTNYGDAGEYIVTITATDGKLVTTQDVKIVVERVNVQPQISGVRDISVNEGDVVTFEPSVEDPNGDPVTVSVSQPLQTGVFTTDHLSAGEYRIVVVASDGELETQEVFTLSVADVNEKPIIKGVPQEVRVTEGQEIRLEPTVSDLDGDDILLTISDPVGDDGVWTPDYTQNGEYVVTVLADDNKDRVSHKVRIFVEDINKPPSIIAVNRGD